MWSAIATIAAAAMNLLAKWMGGDSGKADQRELGRAEQQNADMKADTVVIRRANDAAKAAEEEGTDDPNDRDNRR